MILASPVITLLRYWIVQGVTGMNWVEIMHRLLLEAGIILLFDGVFILVGLSGVWVWLSAFLIDHSLSVILIVHPFAALVHDAGAHRVCYYRDRARFLAYVTDMQDMLVRRQPAYLADALVFGSIVRRVF